VVVVLVALMFAGAGLVTVLYQSLMAGVDDAAAGRVRDVANALQSDAPDGLESDLFSIDQRVVAVQLIAPDGTVMRRSLNENGFVR
jgi:hypothetical protein